ncbi:MAG: aldo/keto reductase [Candidatus Brocadiia bacterium]
MSKKSNAAKLPRRAYGRDGIKLSVIGFGGIVVMETEQSKANRAVAWAVERGVNYFDVAPSYGDSEVQLGPALEPYRKDAFLACKSGEHARAKAEAEFKRSLKRLRTDHFDLFQLHGLCDVKKDVDASFRKDGVMPWLIKRKEAGQVRHIGFSAHTAEAALAALDRYDFDSVLFPLNFAAWHRNQFGPAVIEKARAKGASLLALKMLARQKWPEGEREKSAFRKCWYQPISDAREAELAVKFTLSLPITAAVTPGEEVLMRLAIESALKYEPITKEEQAELKSLAKTLNPLF